MAYRTNNPIDGERVAIHPFRRLREALLGLTHELTRSLKEIHVPFSERRVVLVIGDSIIVLLALWGALRLDPVINTYGFAATRDAEILRWLPLFLICWWVLAALHDLYDLPSSYHWIATVMRILSIGTIGLFLSLLTGWYFQVYLLWLLIALPALGLWRLLYVKLSYLIAAPQRILIFGLEKRAQAIAQLLTQAPRDYQVLGYVGDRPARAHELQSHPPVLGAATDLPALVRELKVDEIVVTTNEPLTKEVFQLLMTCQVQGAKLSKLPDVYEQLYRRIPVQYIDPTWALYAIQGQSMLNPWQRLSKRILDVVVVLMGLPVFALLLPLLALAIRIDSPGPVFYRQVRSGRGGKPFVICKFRTMFTDAEGDGKARWATENDPRITRVGRFLRKTRLDELPQIFNILKGEMSVVGPRPERPEFVAELCETVPFYQVRFMVKPGLTGWAQIHYDYGNSVEDALLKLQYDFYYIRYWSLWVDIYTMFKTLFVVLKFKGT